ncbi:trp region conserved putative membrane protein [Corynebacterium mustelae]|uniref:Trp region conserved putative membrane protein n=1 Tax=Corynebacterium mustelae TaxID=571915 RepID=A0A0G3H3H6_9CORY|nr:TIGR02234 family membrane protein [Corynebacterium mustelae]AKK06383.1 trp region conserved putative membrane protein [Corynebacterium mustelae]
MTKTRIAALLIGVGAAILWGASRMTWLTVQAFDDKSGTKTLDIIGALWSTETTAVSLVLVAACVAALTLRRLARRVVGIIAACAAGIAGWSALDIVLGAGPDPQRALSILSSQTATAHQSKGALLANWAEITDISVHSTGVVVAVLGAALAIFAGTLLAVAPGIDKPKANQYERKQTRESRIEEDLEADPDSGRIMWDALDADIDPTDPKR